MFSKNTVLTVDTYLGLRASRQDFSSDGIQIVFTVTMTMGSAFTTHKCEQIKGHSI